MIIHINDQKTVADIQEKFQVFFPFLKIEFFDQPHHRYEASLDKAPYPGNYKLADIRKKHEHGDLEIHSWHKTGDLEQLFSKKFGLHVQVLRRHGDTWVQTAGTDNLALKEQNDIACRETVGVRAGSDSITAKRSLS